MSEAELRYHQVRAALFIVENVRRGHTTYERHFPWWFNETCRAWCELAEWRRDQLAYARQAPTHYPDSLG
jgi:hypothetical protein